LGFIYSTLFVTYNEVTTDPLTILVEADIGGRQVAITALDGIYHTPKEFVAAWDSVEEGKGKIPQFIPLSVEGVEELILRLKGALEAIE